MTERTVGHGRGVACRAQRAAHSRDELTRQGDELARDEVRGRSMSLPASFGLT
jgi:hypothetical protein